MVFWILKSTPLALCDMTTICSILNIYSAKYHTGTGIDIFQEKYVPTTDSEHITVFYSMEYYVLNAS